MSRAGTDILRAGDATATIHEMRWRTKPPEPVLTKHEVQVMFEWMFDVRDNLVAIRRLLEEADGEAQDPADDA